MTMPVVFFPWTFSDPEVKGRMPKKKHGSPRRTKFGRVLDKLFLRSHPPPDNERLGKILFND